MSGNFNISRDIVQDVVVIGGGPAGLAAAAAVREAGIDSVLLIERDRILGGILNQCVHDGFGLHCFNEALSGPEYAQRFIDRLEKLDVPVMKNSIVLSLSRDLELLVSRMGELTQIKAKAVILATGCRERARGALSIPGHRPSGVYTAGTAQSLVNMENFMPGRRVCILGSGDIGLIMARRMTLEGAKVEAVFELLPQPSGLPRNVRQCLVDYGIPLYLSTTVVDIAGMGRLEGVTVAEVDDNRRPVKGTERFVACDTLLLSVGLIPENELARDAGISINPATGGPLVDERRMTGLPGVFSCGNSLHVYDLVDWVSEDAEQVGRAAAEYVRTGGPGALSVPPLKAANAETASAETANARTANAEAARQAPRGEFVCVLCPNSCVLDVKIEDGKLKSISGNRCKKGKEWVKQEIENPHRTVTTSLSVRGGDFGSVSVRTSRSVPREKIPAVMDAIRALGTLAAPIHTGQILLRNPAGTDTEVIATREVRS